MAIWKKQASLEEMNARNESCAVGHLGIEITEKGDDYLVGRVPVDARTKQPFGLLHGGVSVVLAETLGSVGAFNACPEGHMAVGLDINANCLPSPALTRWIACKQQVVATQHFEGTKPARETGFTRQAGLRRPRRFTCPVPRKSPPRRSPAPHEPATSPICGFEPPLRRPAVARRQPESCASGGS